MNDLSLAGQFPDLSSFQEAVDRIMLIRQEIQRGGASFWCHRSLVYAQVTATSGMQQAVQAMPPSKRSAWMQWITRLGPYWEDVQRHQSADWLESDGELVTDSAVGEAAVCLAYGAPREVVSFDPSAWLRTPIPVRWVRGADDIVQVSVSNHWSLPAIRESLASHPPSIASWTALATRMRSACSRLTFAEDAFEPLRGHPFAAGAAERIQVLLRLLDDFRGCFDEQGQRTAEGHRLYQEHFTGDKAWFSDSSETEKHDFREELTFPCPGNPTQKLFCTWHGKVKTPPVRVHFSWPIRSDCPVYVVYVGPKLTKR